jgi:aromatic ring-opening dioxygenase LigB subunit
MPHGDVIEELGGPNVDLTRQTHLAMLEAGRRMAEARPDTIVIATPHGVRVDDFIGISMTEFAAGGLQGAGGTVMVEMPVDQHMAFAIAQRSFMAGIPIARCSFGTGSGPESRLPLDWGSIIPLWYCGAQWANKPRVVVVVPSRSVDEWALVEFGRIVAGVAAAGPKRVALIASCDWSHTHDEDGPYGFHEDAVKFDDLARDLIGRNDLDGFLELDLEFVENAKPDGIWQTLVLSGAIDGTPLKSEILSYQRPTYFGMLVATFR